VATTQAGTNLNEQVYAELTQYYASTHPSLDTFFIGGGGYTFPRYVEAVYPNSTVDVVEIDPAVTSFVRQRFNLPADSRIRTFNDDARSFLMGWPDPKRYDIIYGDAFNDWSVPYHLTTVEFDVLRALLASAGQVVSREALSEAVLERKFDPFDRSIDMHISKLRRKLDPDDGSERIKTVRGVGYIYAQPSGR
jgi:spermidine synthase